VQACRRNRLGGDARGLQAALNRLFPGQYPQVPEGGAVWAFALD